MGGADPAVPVTSSGAEAILPDPESVDVQPVSADSTSDGEAEEMLYPLSGQLTINEIMAFVGDHYDLSWRDVNAVILSRQSAGTTSRAQMDCLRIVIQTSVAYERSLWNRIGSAMQQFQGMDPTGFMSLFAGIQVLQRLAQRPE